MLEGFNFSSEPDTFLPSNRRLISKTEDTIQRKKLTRLDPNETTWLIRSVGYLCLGLDIRRIPPDSIPLLEMMEIQIFREESGESDIRRMLY